MMANASYADNSRRLSGSGVSGGATPIRQPGLSSMLLSDWNGAVNMLPYVAMDGSGKQGGPSTNSTTADMTTLLSSAGSTAPFIDDAWTMLTHNDGKATMSASISASNYFYDTDDHYAHRQPSESTSPPRPSSSDKLTGKNSPLSTTSDGGLKSASLGAALQKKRKRKQNQSCDQCRNSKRACNLSADSTGPCSTCQTRQLDCSTEWLRSRRRTGKGKHEEDDEEDADDAPDVAMDKRIRRLSTTRIKQEDTTDTSAIVLGNGRKANISAIMAGLSKDTLGAHVKSCKLRIYLGVLEHPFSHWLGNGCSPHMHGLEMAAASPQCILRPFMHLTTGMLTTLSVSSSGPRQPIQPQIVQALGLLDAFLLISSMQRRGVNALQVNDDCPRWRKIRQTNRDIDDALIWAAIANSCQFSGGGGSEDRNGQPDRTQAIALWEMARNVLFNHVSSSSFRIAFAFVIFGITTPPRWDETGSSQPQPSEDVVFAIGHGVRTLRKQSVFVKQVLSTLHFEPGVAESVSDGVWPMSMHAPVTAAANALLWFCDLSEAAIGTVMKRCRVYQCDRETLDVDDDLRSSNILDALTAHMSSSLSATGGNVDDATGQFLFPTNDGGNDDKGVAIAFTPSPLPDFAMEMGTSWQIDSPWKRIWLRSHQASMMESVYGVCGDGGGASLELMHCAPHSILSRLRNASAFKALIWKAVADLEPFIDRCGTGQSRVRDAIRYFNAGTVAWELAKQWKEFYHGFMESIMQGYSSLAPEEKTMFGFLVHHINLAFFYLDDLDQRALTTCFDPQLCMAASEAAQLAVLRERFLESIKHRRAFGRVEDAKFVARICEQAQLNVALDNAISADHAEMSLDADLIASKPMGQWSHPFPPTLIQAQAHAADVLLSEAEIVSLELLNAAPNEVAQRQLALYELLKYADDCLFSLTSLQQAMFAFPSHALGGQRTVADMQRRRAALSM